MTNVHKMTKNQIIDLYFEIMKDYTPWADRLIELVSQDRITSGALYIYDAYQSYGRQKISEMFNKAGKAKSFSQYIGCNTTKFDWTYSILKLQDDIAKTKLFIETQEQLPFEQTQKQLLIANGEINYID